jgi:hypothetical protein
MSAKWKAFEDYLEAYHNTGEEITAESVANTMGTVVEEASDYIQAHLTAQRGKKSQTLYVLHRVEKTRTKNARWLVGERTKDARNVSKAFYDDVRCKVENAVVPDLERMGVIKPSTRRYAENKVNAFVNSTLAGLEALVNDLVQEAEPPTYRY